MTQLGHSVILRSGNVQLSTFMEPELDDAKLRNASAVTRVVRALESNHFVFEMVCASRGTQCDYRGISHEEGQHPCIDGMRWHQVSPEDFTTQFVVRTPV